MNSVEENLSLIKTEEELRNWIRNYARSIPEEERGSFLEQIQIRKSRRSENRAVTKKYCRSLQTGVQRSKRAKLRFPAAAMKNMEKAGGTATG